MSTGTVARVPRPWLFNLPALAWLPASAPSVQGLPAPPPGGRTRPARSLPGPARSDVESFSATSSPLPDHISLTAPNDSCRKPSSCRSAAHPRPPVGPAPPGTPNPPPGTTPGTVFPMARQAQGFQRKPTPILAPVTTSLRKDSTVSAWGALPFPQAPCNGNRETLPAPGRTPLPVPADSPDSPIWPSIQGQF